MNFERGHWSQPESTASPGVSGTDSGRTSRAGAVHFLFTSAAHTRTDTRRVVLGLAALGLSLLYAALKGGWQPDEEKETVPDRPALLWVVAGLALNVLLITYGGFTIASVVLFICVARGFGSKAILRDAGIGAAFALIAYFGFAQTLGINIGAGLIENALNSLFGLDPGS